MPTIKQERAVKELVENGRNYNSMAKVLEKVGYAPAMVTHPKRVTDSLGFLALVEKELADGKLLKIHNKLLSSKNENVQTQNLKLAYEIKGRMKPREEEGTSTKVLNITNILNIIEKVELEEKNKPHTSPQSNETPTP